MSSRSRALGVAVLAAALTGSMAMAPVVGQPHADGLGDPPGHGVSPPGADRMEPVADSPTVPNPMVTGPITHGIRGGAYNRTRFPLEPGYVEQEFFFEGVARAADGSTAPYRTRILVRRPTDPAQFNGGVVVDWTNVTVPDDTDVGWLPLHDSIMERGYAYVSVAAQRLGVELSPLGLKQYDPVRYGSLQHPGDDWSFDIFSQASEAVIDPVVLGDLADHVTRRLAIGASQSGGRLKTYINDFHEDHDVYEAFMPEISGPDGVRRDLDPVLWLNSQSEVGAETVEPDSGNFVLWEVAGSAHAPHSYTQWQHGGYAFHETNGTVEVYDPEEGGAWGYQLAPGECHVPNVFEPGYAYSAALVALDTWLVSGERPQGFRADRTDGTLHHDEWGNLVGGVPSPMIDAPIARYFAGEALTDHGVCGTIGFAPLLGASENLTAEDLAERYESSRDFAEEFEASLARALELGVVLPEGARDMRRRLQFAQRYVAEALGEVASSPRPPVTPPVGVPQPPPTR